MVDLSLPRRLVLPLAAALALVPASANAQAPERSFQQAAYGHVLPGSSSTRTGMAFECAAVATGDAASVEITSCFLRGANGATYHAPSGVQAGGPAAMRSHVLLSVPMQPYRPCVSSRVRWLDGTTATASLQCFG